MNAVIVPSETTEGLTYSVSIDASGRPYCTCPAWKYNTETDKRGRKVCKHIRTAFKRLPRVKNNISRNSVKWVQQRCSKCRADRYTSAILGMRCLRCGKEVM